MRMMKYFSGLGHKYLVPSLLAGALGLGTMYCSRTQKEDLRIFDCSGDKLKLDDGDTIYCQEEAVRILGIDAPEIKHPEVGIFEDQPFGPEAAQYAQNTFEKAKIITVLSKNKDKYRRTLGHVLVDSELYASKIIKAGLAYETISVYGDDGFPGLAQIIREAWEETSKPPFVNPHEWRKQHQIKTRGIPPL